jgi:hypothetical protein
MDSRRTISKRHLISFLVWAILGFVFPRMQFPELRIVQILIPYFFGMAAGISLGRMHAEVRP